MVALRRAAATVERRARGTSEEQGWARANRSDLGSAGSGTSPRCQASPSRVPARARSRWIFTLVTGRAAIARAVSRIIAGDSPGHFKQAFTRALALGGGDPRRVRLASFREHGAVTDLNKAQLNDLIQYLRTL